MNSIALTRQQVACINGLLVSSQKTNPETGFSTDEIVELFESLMPESAQRIEPVWSTRASSWQWQPVS
ncbi:MAG: hypothetical protein KF753_16530 [Caldilineaceae bacterium]|nr:hypothetical protein [Caldilineaceae bacterium]